MRSSTIKNNFTSGELTPLMYGRTELEPYQKGLAECVNMRVLRHGGVTRRNGTRYINEVKDSSKTVRLVPFVFSENDAVVLEVGNGYIRFLDGGGHILGGTEEVINGTFDTDIISWTPVISGFSTLTWVAISQAMKLRTSAIGSVKARQTLTGLTAGVAHTLKFDAFVRTGSNVFIKLGTTLGGSEYVNAVPVNGINVFSVTFTNATAYIEFENTETLFLGEMNIDNISIKNNAALAEVVTPYLESELFELMYAQSNDLMWFTHKNHPPKILTRTTTSAFTFADAIINQGPFAPINTGGITMALTAGAWIAGSAGTLTASAAYFALTDVGEHFIIYNDSDLTIFAVVKTSGYTSTTVMSVIFTIDVPVSLQTGANVTWSIQAIGDRSGFPAAVSFHDQRLIYAGTATQPQNIFGSTVADFNSFTVGTDDDDHYNYQLASTKQNEINFLAVKHDLIIGTLSNEWGMRGGGLEDPITPSNVVTRPYRSEGSIRVQPEEMNDLITFVQRAGHKIIGLVYDEGSRALTTNDMMLLAEHLTTSSIVKQLSYQSERESILWAVTDSGQLLGLTYDASQDIAAWHQHNTALSGEFESVATVPVTDSDQTWVVVKRNVNGSDVRYIEHLDDKDWREDDDPYYLDCGISYSGAAVTVMTGLAHLEGEEVSVYASGEHIGEFTVASGQITLPNAVTQAHIGLNFVSSIKELPEGSDTQDGSAHTRQKRKPVVDVRLYKTQGIKVNGDIRDLPRDASVVKPELFSGIIETSKLGWDKDAQNTIESIGPNPLTVLAIRSTLNVGQE